MNLTIVQPKTVSLRFCNDDIRVVDEDWWARFLRSQEMAFAKREMRRRAAKKESYKNIVDKHTGLSVKSGTRGTSTDGNSLLGQGKEGSGRNAKQVRG